ncbi:MAG: asparagine synthase (glutamine-hydrolyzing) [Bacteroidota bacterium]
MCGINGIVGFSNLQDASAKLILMNQTLQHRGPDDNGTWFSNECVLGQQRLSIIDLSSAGHQPMLSNDERYVIVFNGEIYNFLEVKNKLQNEYQFKTKTDTEVILAAFIKWGKKCVDELNGMFAFAIWDKQTSELFIARDRMGVKPLYYVFENNTLAFSSEIRPLLKAGFAPKKIDYNSLIDYLQYQTVHAPNTILQNVKMLMPGCQLHFKNKTITTEQYWDINSKINTNLSADKSYNEICSDVNKLFTNAVESRLVADVPFGAFLSGGIDSSAVVGVMSKISNHKVKTFTITFDESEFSEAKYAATVAEKFNTEHHEIKLTPKDFLHEIPNALKAMDHPSGDGPNTYIVSKATKNAGVTMALSGIGGDELFAGYDVFKRSLSLQKNNWVTSLPSFVKEATAQLMMKFKPGVASNKFNYLLNLSNWNIKNTFPYARTVMLNHQLNFILAKPQTNFENKVFNQLKNIPELKNYSLSSVSVAEITTYMQNVLLRDTDQMSMAHALEIREPFLDYKLVEYVLSVNDKHKFPVTPKKLFVDAMDDLLPSDIVNRKKMGFTLPWKHWMTNELKSFCEERIISLAKREYFNEKNLLDFWNQFLQNHPSVTWSRIWYLVVLENWLQQHEVE